MSQSNDAPREWFLYKAVIDDDDTLTAVRRMPDDLVQYENMTLVIEYSAYQSAITELNRVRDLLTRGEHSVIKERDELKAENAKYRAEMAKITAGIPSEWAYAILQKERDELRAKLDVARAALEYQLIAYRKIFEGSMFTPESERAAAEKKSHEALEKLK